MIEQALAPGMQDREEAAARAEAPGIGRQLQQSLGDGSEQQTVEDPLILESQRRQRSRNRKDDMAVAHRQQLLGSSPSQRSRAVD